MLWRVDGTRDTHALSPAADTGGAAEAACAVGGPAVIFSVVVKQLLEGLQLGHCLQSVQCASMAEE